MEKGVRLAQSSNLAAKQLSIHELKAAGIHLLLSSTRLITSPKPTLITQKIPTIFFSVVVR
jgi:hypothetical protein